MEGAAPPRRARRKVVRRAEDVPVAVVDELLAEMAAALSGSDVARRCPGLSLTIVMSDHDAAPARFDVAPGGVVRLSRGLSAEPTFTVSGPAGIMDRMLRGQIGALAAIVSGRVQVVGPVLRLYALLRLFPAVQAAYGTTRTAVERRHAPRYVFAF